MCSEGLWWCMLLASGVFLLNVSLCLIWTWVNSKWFSSLCFLGIMYGVIHFEIQRETVVCAQMSSRQECHSRQRMIFIDPSRKKRACVLWCQKKHWLHLIMEGKVAHKPVLRTTALQSLNISKLEDGVGCEYIRSLGWTHTHYYV